jgi:hypothetical protein
MTATVLDVLCHATGVAVCLRQHSYRPGWRNWYAACPGHSGYAACQAAVEQGLMVSEPDGDGVMFLVTPAGMAEVERWYESQRLPLWEISDHDGFVSYELAATRSKARANVIRAIMEVSCCSWKSAAKRIRSVKQIPYPAAQPAQGTVPRGDP